jgi:hypothetical protein
MRGDHSGGETIVIIFFNATVKMNLGRLVDFLNIKIFAMASTRPSEKIPQQMDKGTFPAFIRWVNHVDQSEPISIFQYGLEF